MYHVPYEALSPFQQNFYRELNTFIETMEPFILVNKQTRETTKVNRGIDTFQFLKCGTVTKVISHFSKFP